MVRPRRLLPACVPAALVLLSPVLVSHTAAQDKGKPDPVEAKAGAAVYDGVKEPERSRLVEAWKKEVGSVREELEAEEELARKAKTFWEGKYYKYAIGEHKKRLARLEKNDPPFRGAAPYDDFIEPWRGRFAEGYRADVEAVKKTIREARLAAAEAKTPRDQQAALKRLKDAEGRLDRLDANDPPFVTSGEGCSSASPTTVPTTGLTAPGSWSSARRRASPTASSGVEQQTGRA